MEIAFLQELIGFPMLRKLLINVLKHVIYTSYFCLKCWIFTRASAEFSRAQQLNAHLWRDLQGKIRPISGVFAAQFFQFHVPCWDRIQKFARWSDAVNRIVNEQSNWKNKAIWWVLKRERAHQLTPRTRDSWVSVEIVFLLRIKGPSFCTIWERTSFRRSNMADLADN